MKPTIKMIEDLSLNAWPSHQIQLYDGWLLRFSYFYTHRTNCVEQIGPSSIPIEEKIDFCEDAYHRWGTPSIFKITPLLPDDFEKRLIDRRYAVQHVTEVMTLDLAPWQITMPPVSVRLERTINDRWIQSLFALKSTTSAIHRQIVPSMYHAIPKDTLAASITNSDGQIVAIGLGILDRSYMGIYAIHVHPYYRGRHLYFFVKSRKRAGNDRGLSAGRRGEYSCQAAVSFSWIRRLLQLPFPGKRIILKLQKTGTFSSDVPVFCNCSRNYSVATVPRGVLA